MSPQRAAQRFWVGLQDLAFGCLAPLTGARDDLALAVAHDDQESLYERRAFAIVGRCAGCSRTALPLLLRAERYDRLERLATERADRHVAEGQGYGRQLSGVIDAQRDSTSDQKWLPAGSNGEAA